MRFEDILADLEAQGYTIVAILSNEDPYKRQVIIKDTNGNQMIKNYVLAGFVDIKDDSNNVIGVDEDWVEVQS